MAQVLLMPRWCLKKGKRSALPLFLWASATGMVVNPAASLAQEVDRPPVYQQKFDDDCGVAALRMLLQRAGIDVGDEQLLAGLRSTSGENALTAADLTDMVQNLNAGIRLEVGFLPLDKAAELASREPFLVLMTPRSIGGSDAVDHFILIEGKVSGAFIVADPVLPSRTLLSERLFHSDVHGKSINGKRFAMVLRLTKDGSAISRQIPAEERDSTLRDWDQAYLLPRSLPRGKWVINASQIKQNDAISIPDEGIDVRSTADVSIISVARGLGNRTHLTLNLARISGSGNFRLPGESFSFQRSGTYNAGLRIDHIHDVGLPSSFEVTSSVGLEWDSVALPSAATASAVVQWARGRFIAGTIVDVRYDGTLLAVATPSISYRLPTKSGVTLEATASMPYQIGNGESGIDLQLSASRNIGMDFGVSAFWGRRVFQNSGIGHSQFGLSLSYGVPRRFRRAQFDENHP